MLTTVLLVVLSAPVCGLDEKPQAATVRLNNGLIRSGMVSSTSTLAPFPPGTRQVDRPDQKLSMRLIDQKYREIYVPVRRSEAPVLDVNAFPAVSWRIPFQGLPRRSSLPPILPLLEPFDVTGVARGTVTRPNGEEQKVENTIVSFNELFAEVNSRTHHWQYAVSFRSIPRENLLSIMSKSEDFQTKSSVRLELVRMLMRADRIPEAGLLLQQIAADFPDAAALCQTQMQLIREQTARQITTVLEKRREVGQHRIASNGARLHPRNDLTPETVVRVETLVRDYDDFAKRLERIRQLLPALAAQVQDPATREAVVQQVRSVCGRIDEDSIARFASFELMLAVPEEQRPDAETQLATALSGWLLGAEQTVPSLVDVRFLYDAQQLVIDYLNTGPDEDAERQVIADSITKLEGVSVERIAAMIRNLPTPTPLHIHSDSEAGPGWFELPAENGRCGAVGFVPPEYHESRLYPAILAFPGSSGDPRRWLAWWQQEAISRGVIVVMPVWPADESGTQSNVETWDASAASHQQLLTLIRTLRLSLQIDCDRFFAAGHGVGGEIALDLVTSHPHVFAGAAAISSTGRRHLQWTIANAIEKPLYLVTGDLHPFWFDRMSQLTVKLFRRSEEVPSYFDILFVKYPNRGAESFPEEATDILEWTTRFQRVRYPNQIAAKLLRSTDLDWSWIQLDSLPAQFCQLDAASDPTSEGFRPATLKARITTSNAIIIESTPAPLRVHLSPEMPELNLAEPVRIVNGRNKVTVDYQPSIATILKTLYETGDRSRLTYMEVQVDD